MMKRSLATVMGLMLVSAMFLACGKQEAKQAEPAVEGAAQETGQAGHDAAQATGEAVPAAGAAGGAGQAAGGAAPEAGQATGEAAQGTGEATKEAGGGIKPSQGLRLGQIAAAARGAIIDCSRAVARW